MSAPSSTSPPTIVFSSARALDGSDAANTNGADNIWVVSADGNVATPLTRDITGDSGDAVWSPDGTMIAFDSNRVPSPGNGNDIWVMKTDGSGLTQLTEFGTVPIGSAHNPDWSPDGHELAFTELCCGLGSQFKVAVVNADGSGFIPLPGVPVFPFPAVGSFAPRWSPNGSKFIFVSQLAVDNTPALNVNTTGNIWVMNADGSGQAALTKVTAKNAGCSNPIWSPDGSRVAFVSARALDGSDANDANNTSNIWVMNPDGSGLMPITRLTAPGAGSTSPVWSPDGSKMAFESSGALDGSDASNTNITSNIWVMNADGTGITALTKLTARSASSHDPAWSPTGSQIVFDSLRAIDGSDSANTASNIWAMNADGSHATPLTKSKASGADSNRPKWHP